MSVGYSGVPLLDKLGIKPDTRIAIVRPPERYDQILGELPRGVRRLQRPGRAMDFVHCFCIRATELCRRFPALRCSLAPKGILWISWPKKSSPLHVDLGEGEVRAIGVANGLVDVKICVVDTDWSALKFVCRLADRPLVNRR